MAIVSKLNRGGTEVDFNDTTTGLSLSGDGWLPAVATPTYGRDPAPVIETLHMRLTQSSQDNLAARIQQLHRMQYWADAYSNDPGIETPVWIHAKMDNETEERRAMVYRIEAQYAASWYGDEATSLDVPVTLAITRSPYWEDITARDLPADTGITGFSDTYDYTAAGASSGAHDLVGDTGARISYFEITQTATARRLYWMGLRSQKHGANAISDFLNVWECEDGTNGTDSTDEADGNASGGNRVTVAESALEWDDTWQACLTIDEVDADSVNKVSGKQGTFQWLLRVSVTSGTWEVQMKQSPSGYIADEVAGPVREVTGTSYHIKEMGVFSIPPWNVKSITSDYYYPTDSTCTFRIYARRTSGSGNLYLDALAPIPVDEGFCKIEVPYADANPLRFGQSPSGAWDAITGTTVFGYSHVDIEANTFNPPVNVTGQGAIIIASARSLTSQVLTDTLSLNASDAGKYFERWLSLRGSEGP